MTEPQIDVTPEMIAAGLSELASEAWGESEEEHVARIYRAMEAERISVRQPLLRDEIAAYFDDERASKLELYPNEVRDIVDDITLHLSAYLKQMRRRDG